MERRVERWRKWGGGKREEEDAVSGLNPLTLNTFRHTALVPFSHARTTYETRMCPHSGLAQSPDVTTLRHERSPRLSSEGHPRTRALVSVETMRFDRLISSARTSSASDRNAVTRLANEHPRG